MIELATLNPQKAIQLAEEGLVKDPDNIDFLMTIADHDMSLERNLPQVLTYSLRILELVQGKPQPADITPAEWEKKKAKFTGWASWLAGVVYGKQARYGLSDRYLRVALSYIQEDHRLLAAAYFYLGYANYALAGELADKGRATRSGEVQQAVRGHGLAFPFAGPQKSGSFAQRLQRRIAGAGARFTAHLHLPPQCEASWIVFHVART